jgi:uncharacterized protein
VSQPPGPGEARVAGSQPAVVMLARSPFVAGKTRLSAVLDHRHATALRAALLLDTIESALAVGWPLHLHLEPAGHASQVETLVAADQVLAPHTSRVQWHPQAGGDLGARMIAAVETTLAAGHDVAVLVGSDIPDLPLAAFTEARAGLVDLPRGTRVAFGPASDGGFYLVAATDVASLAAAFGGVTWSQPSVLADVTARLAASGREARLVASWHDLDTTADLDALLARPGEGARRTRAVARRLPP